MIFFKIQPLFNPVFDLHTAVTARSRFHTTVRSRLAFSIRPELDYLSVRFIWLLIP